MVQSLPPPFRSPTRPALSQLTFPYPEPKPSTLRGCPRGGVTLSLPRLLQCVFHEENAVPFLLKMLWLNRLGNVKTSGVALARLVRAARF